MKLIKEANLKEVWFMEAMCKDDGYGCYRTFEIYIPDLVCICSCYYWVMRKM